MTFITTPNYVINVEEVASICLDVQLHSRLDGRVAESDGYKVAIWFKGSSTAQHYANEDANAIRFFCLPFWATELGGERVLVKKAMTGDLLDNYKWKQP